MTIHTIHGLSGHHYQELNVGSAIGDLRIPQRYYQIVTAVMTKPEVRDALNRLSGFLRGIGAKGSRRARLRKPGTT